MIDYQTSFPNYREDEKIKKSGFWILLILDNIVSIQIVLLSSTFNIACFMKIHCLRLTFRTLMSDL